MKKMWCEYTCNAEQYKFTKPTGKKFDDVVNHECTLVTINLDPAMACNMFNSCSKTSYISQLQLTSSQAFLDFQGSNAKVKSFTIISFDLTQTDPDQRLSVPMHDCDVKLPADKTLDGYTGLTECSCAYCQDACKAPVVNAYIGFFDGMDGYLVLYVYIALVIASLLLWVAKRQLSKRSKDTVYAVSSRQASVTH